MRGLQIGNPYKNTIAGLISTIALRRNGIIGSSSTYECFSANTVEASQRARVTILLTPAVDSPKQAHFHKFVGCTVLEMSAMWLI
jgi:hypothetical protein